MSSNLECFTKYNNIPTPDQNFNWALGEISNSPFPGLILIDFVTAGAGNFFIFSTRSSQNNN
jgi:hypothetical protein